MLFAFRFWHLWSICCCDLLAICGGTSCLRTFLRSINITTVLHSDVLLPCYFEPVLLGSDKTADIAVVWSHINATQPNLLEITLSGEVRPWNRKNGRIKTFPKFTESGNFSVLLREVQVSDLGLYRCELFNGTGCSIAYQEMQLYNSPPHDWSVTAGVAGAGAVFLCLLLACVLYMLWKQRGNASLQQTQGVSSELTNVKQTEICRGPLDNPVYAVVNHIRQKTWSDSTSHSRFTETVPMKDNPIYSTVKKKNQPSRDRDEHVEYSVVRFHVTGTNSSDG